MNPLDFLKVIYLIVAIFAMIMTWREQRQKGQTSLAANLSGFAACLSWPVVFPLVFLLAQRRQA